MPNRFRVVADDIGMQPEDGRLRKDVTKTSHSVSVSLLRFHWQLTAIKETNLRSIPRLQRLAEWHLHAGGLEKWRRQCWR